MNQRTNQFITRSYYLTTVMTVLTSIHHLYGGLVYHTSWRIHGIAGGGLAFLAAYAFYRSYMTSGKQRDLTAYITISTAVFALLVGMYEGLYNHVLKNLLYFGGMDHALWRQFFPAPLYEVPDNWFFEITGIIQAAIGVGILYYNYQIVRRRKVVKGS